MNSIDLIRMGFKNLWRRKLRTFLTVLGVIIGTASIVIMVSMGIGMNESFKQELSRMGSLNIINVYPGYNDMYMEAPRGGSRRGNSTALDDEAILRISQINGVEAVSPLLETYLKFISGKYTAHIQIMGIRPDSMEALEFVAKEGRLLEDGDAFNLVFGSQIPMMFYDQRARNRFYYGPPQEANVDVLKDRLEMTFDMSYGDRNAPQQGNNKPPKVYKVKGVGILQEGDYEKDYYAFMAIDQLKKIIDENNKEQSRSGGGQKTQQQQGYNRAKVKVKNINDVQKVQDQIKEMGYNAHSLTDILKQMQSTSATLQAVLGGIGAVSLLVAALGITNTMIMSIYERTKEIGIMKVIGASFSDIRRLFLFEAGMIGFLGGLLGIGISKLISYLLNSAGFKLINFFGPGGPGSKISIIPLWLALSCIAFATFVGLISGFYPARRAMKLSALEAIRTE